MAISKIDLILNWMIIILGIALCILIFVLPINDCSMCNFDGQDGNEFFSEYSKRCLQKYNIAQDNPNGVALKVARSVLND